MVAGVISSVMTAAITPHYTSQMVQSHRPIKPEDARQLLAVTEKFENMTPVRNDVNKVALISFLTFVVVFFLLLVLGKTLWNSVLIQLFPFVKPAKSIWQILGLSVLIGLIVPGCSCMV
jgi:cytochrome b subunit of formate dehydrogenase